MSEPHDEIEPAQQFNLHMVSDATGETILGVVRACIVQFEHFHAHKFLWPMVRTERGLRDAIDQIAERPGPVLFTLLDDNLRRQLIEACRTINVPCISVLDTVLASLSDYLGTSHRNQPGRQHELDDRYFERIEAMQYALAHDDGQGLSRLSEAQIVLTGVSRTSKTPTCMYLANRGIRAANVPIVPGMAPPRELLDCKNALVVGLTTDPQRLVQVRRNRLATMQEERDVAYVDPEQVAAEVKEAKLLCARQGWPTLDVTRRSIEETAAAILQLYKRQTRNTEEP